ncbi:MAG: FAD-dependent oxidoreductase, partial [Halanaerobiaceae bacterium]
MSKNVVVLGAGYGGVEAAEKLNKLLKKEEDVTITLIDKNPFHTLLTELHLVAGKKIEENGVKVDLERLFSPTKVNVVQDYITDFDFDNKKLFSREHEYSYDYLIVGTGSKPSDCGVEGVKDETFTLWSIEDALEIREHVYNMFQDASITNDSEKRKELLSFIVAGGGFTGVEMVGELIDWLNELCDHYQVPREDVRLYLCEGLDKILPNLDNKLADKARKFLEKNDVNVKTGNFVSEIDGNTVVFEDGEEVNCRTIIWACGVQASDLAEDAGLTSDRSGRIKVNKYLQSVDYPGVYAIGDNAAAPWKEDKDLPALVEAAIQTGECAAGNVAAEIKGEKKEELDANLHGVLVSIGGDYAVAELMGLSLQGKKAMFMKHFVNMHYLFDIGGIREGFAMVKEYIDEQGENRGFIPRLFDQFRQKSRTIWLVLLRVFIGVMWIVEAYSKSVGEDSWLVSGASPEVPVGPHIVGWVQSIMDYINQYPELVNIVKRLIIYTEYALGICLILGLFTFLAALGSVIMSFNLFLAGFGGPINSLSEMLGGESVAQPEIKWYFFGSIALLANSGRAFGLDYFVMPWLKRKIWGE